MSQASMDYVRLLWPRLLGHPIWKPTPDANLPDEYRSKGISIGDVGFLSPNGEFDFLFSICVPSDHAINSRGVPDMFENVWPQIQIEKQEGYHCPDTVIASTSMKIKSAGVNASLHGSTHVPVGVEGLFHFTCSTSEGAILLLPEGGSQENLLDKGIFLEQAKKHGLRWHNYALVSRNRLAQDASLYLVTGCDKTSSWGIASFSNTSGEDEVSLKFEACRLATIGASYTYKWETTSPATVRVGPPSRDYLAQEHTREPASTFSRAIYWLFSVLVFLLNTVLESTRLSFRRARSQNQCVFVRGYTISVRSGIFGPFGRKKKSVAVTSGGAEGGSSRDRDNDEGTPFFSDRGNRSWFQGFDDGAVLGRRRHAPPEPVENQEIDGDQGEGSASEDIVIEAVPAAPNFYPLLTAINDYLLDTSPEAQVAVTHDDVLLTLFHKDGVIPNDEILSHLHDRYSVEVSHGAVTFAKKESPYMAKTDDLSRLFPSMMSGVPKTPERKSWMILILSQLTDIFRSYQEIIAYVVVYMMMFIGRNSPVFLGFVVFLLISLSSIMEMINYHDRNGLSFWIIIRQRSCHIVGIITLIDIVGSLLYGCFIWTHDYQHAEHLQIVPQVVGLLLGVVLNITLAIFKKKAMSQSVVEVSHQGRSGFMFDDTIRRRHMSSAVQLSSPDFPIGKSEKKKGGQKGRNS